MVSVERTPNDSPSRISLGVYSTLLMFGIASSISNISMVECAKLSVTSSSSYTLVRRQVASVL